VISARESRLFNDIKAKMDLSQTYSAIDAYNPFDNSKLPSIPSSRTIKEDFTAVGVAGGGIDAHLDLNGLRRQRLQSHK
jgi:hypothetical protein